MERKMEETEPAALAPRLQRSAAMPSTIFAVCLPQSRRSSWRVQSRRGSEPVGAIGIEA
jgi:hypothetical protein